MPPCHWLGSPANLELMRVVSGKGKKELRHTTRLGLRRRGEALLQKKVRRRPCCSNGNYAYKLGAMVVSLHNEQN